MTAITTPLKILNDSRPKLGTMGFILHCSQRFYFTPVTSRTQSIRLFESTVFVIMTWKYQSAPELLENVFVVNLPEVTLKI